MFLNEILLYYKSIYNYKIHIFIFLIQGLFLYIKIALHKKENIIFLIIAIINNILLSILGVFNIYYQINNYSLYTKILFISSIINFTIGFYFNFLKSFIKKKKYEVLYKNMICPCCILQLLIQPFGLFLNNYIFISILFIQFILLIYLILKKNTHLTIYISILINIIYYLNKNFLFNKYLRIILLIFTFFNIIYGLYSLYNKKKININHNKKCCDH